MVTVFVTDAGSPTKAGTRALFIVRAMQLPTAVPASGEPPAITAWVAMPEGAKVTSTWALPVCSPSAQPVAAAAAAPTAASAAARSNSAGGAAVSSSGGSSSHAVMLALGTGADAVARSATVGAASTTGKPLPPPEG